MKNTFQNKPTCLNDKNKNITSPKEISEKFNNFFATIAEKIKNTIVETRSSHKDYLKNPNLNSMFINPTTAKEILSIIKQFNAQKAIGPVSIPSNILKLVSNIISESLSQIINLSFETGEFPTLLKTTEVIPIHKKDSKLLCTNYRPISLLSNIGKIFEKLMHARVHHFLEQYKCLYSLQYGFRNKHSTNHALIKITETIRQAIDDKNYACGVFIDLQKAFDTVNHEILLDKLNFYGIRGVANNWFKTYLTNRLQYVSISGSKSSLLHIGNGVPQGSVLGPLLFLIYINDLNSAIQHSITHHFADDTYLLYTNKSLKKINKYVNHDLKLLCDWLRANKISLNAKKTEIIVFRSKQKQDISKHLNFRISGQRIALSSRIKYLGLTLDENVWETHITNLTAKLSRAIGMLAKLRHYVNYNTLISTYYSLFHSHIIYRCQMWAQEKTIKTEKIQKLQNKLLRIIHFKEKEHTC